MNEIALAIDGVRRLAHQYESVIALAKVLDSLGSIEQALSERQSRLSSLVAQCDEEDLRLSRLSRDADELQKKMNADRDACCESIDRAISAASDQSEKIIEAARETAQRMAHDGEVRVTEYRTLLADLQASIEAKNRELSDIETKVERARSKMQELLRA